MSKTDMINIIAYFSIMFLKRVILFLTTLMLLFADSGQTLYAHTCLKSKHTHVTIGAPKHCCTNSSTEKHCGVKKASCCEIKSKYLKLNFVSDSNQPHSTLNTFCFLNTSTTIMEWIEKTSDLRIAYHYPPLTGINRASHRFTGNFRI